MQTATRPGVDELAFYRRICEVASAADADALLARALEAAVELSGADGGHLVLAEPGPVGELPILLSRGAAPTISQTIVRRALETGRTMRIENALDDPAYRRLGSVLALNILSVLVVPIAHDGSVLAALHLVSSRLAGVFGPAAEQVVTSFAARIAPALHAWVEARRLVRARDELQARLEGVTGSVGLVGAHPAFLAVADQVARVAPTDVPVLLLGESGTGKEVLARAIHRQSARRDGPWVAVNCGAIPEALLESELFGHEKGAFTGAARRAGKFSTAHGGTIFLDEVGELSPTCQVGLLRALQSGEVQRVGSDELIEVDVRVVPRRTARCGASPRRGASARTSSTGWAWSRSRSLPCGSAGTTCSSWRSTSPAGTPWRSAVRTGPSRPRPAPRSWPTPSGATSASSRTCSAGR